LLVMLVEVLRIVHLGLLRGIECSIVQIGAGGATCLCDGEMIPRAVSFWAAGVRLARTRAVFFSTLEQHVPCGA
jgi:hypothetical protein